MNINKLLEVKGDSNISHYNKYLPIRNYNIIMISKNANSSIGVLYCNENNISLLKLNDNFNNYTYRHLNIKYNKWSIIGKYVLDIAKDRKYIMIYRDPVERFFSAKTVLDPTIRTFETNNDYIQTFGNILKDYYTNKTDKLPNFNYHIQPQTNFISNISMDDIELFIEMKDLRNWFKENNFEVPVINKMRNSLKKYDKNILTEYLPYIKKYYSCDYDFIENIPEDKKYNGEQYEQ